MRFKILSPLLGLVILSGVANADEQELPAVNLLPCDPSCANSTRAKNLNNLKPEYPTAFFGEYVEAFVEIRYTVATDGTVRDVNLLRLIGPPQFADAVLRRTQTWKFQPATVNGKPVEQSLEFVTVFRQPNFTPGARNDVVAVYGKAADLLKQDKTDEAQSLLNAALAKPELNFYERGMLSLLLAPILEQKKDFQKVHELTMVPTTSFADELPPAALQYLLKFRIESALHLGDVPDAMTAFNHLVQTKGFDPKDPIVGLLSKTRAQLDQSDVIAVDARIPEAGQGDEIYLRLYRRDIGFQNVAGLNKFTVSCNQGAVESEISDKAQWHIPNDWNACTIYVRGAPGTSFQVLEFSPQIAQTPAKQ